MNIKEIFSFGKYKGLRMLDVYRGTMNLDRNLLRSYIEFVLNSQYRLSFESYFGVGVFEFVDKFEVTENEIKALVFHEKGIDINGEPFGDFEEIGDNIERDLELCLSIGNKCLGYEIGGFLSLEKFNQNYANNLVVGADPGYLAWCIENLSNFYIPVNQIAALEELRICQFNGFHVIWKDGGGFEYCPNIEIKCYKFSNKAHELNKAKIIRMEFEHNNECAYSHESGPSAYGYSSWDEMAFNEAYEQDSESWEHDNQ